MLYNHLEKFRQGIRDGKLMLGCVITFTDPAVTEIAAESGFDFCWIDGEHGTLDRHTAMTHIMALKGTGCAPFYRVPSCDYTEIKRIIDFAPAGVIVPMVLNAEDARTAVSACRYPPEGTRGCGFRRGNRYGVTPNQEYLELSRKDPMVILQIEHITAVRNLDEILAVPGVDSVLIGPYDLTMSMGKPGEWHDPEVTAVLDEVCRKTRAAGILLGAYSECDYDRWIRRNVQYIALKNDTNAMMLGFRHMIHEARSAADHARD